MNLHLIAAEISRRFDALAEDCPINRMIAIEAILRDAQIPDCPRCAQLEESLANANRVASDYRKAYEEAFKNLQNTFMKVP